ANTVAHVALKLFIFNTPNTFSGVWTYLGQGVKAGIPCLLGNEGRFLAFWTRLWSEIYVCCTFHKGDEQSGFVSIG
ncbi:MAG: hypothetical protein ACI84R_001107, partial [Candidatus Azotimanducaceae bacterium]